MGHYDEKSNVPTSMEINRKLNGIDRVKKLKKKNEMLILNHSKLLLIKLSLFLKITLWIIH